MANISNETIRKTLDAMYFNFAPSIDYDEEINEWTEDLIDSYNEIIYELSEDELKEINSIEPKVSHERVLL